VTGASGFVGRAAVAALQRRGFELHGVGRSVPDALPPIRWHRADVLRAGEVEEVVRAVRPSHALHLAWVTEHGRYWDDPENEAWVGATRRLAEAFLGGGGVRFVFVGSCAQYEWGAADTLSETTSPRLPATRYGRAKQEAAELIEAVARDGGISSAAALLFFPYGPHEHPDRLIPSVARRVLAGEEAPVSSGTQVRDLLHVGDCGSALACLVDSDVAGSVNVGSGVGHTVAEIAGSVARLAGGPELLRRQRTRRR
jgi:nucleoside-diphosphate-sugar epimerase